MGSLFSTSCKSHQDDGVRDGDNTKADEPAPNPKLETVDPEFLALRETWQKEQDELKEKMTLIDTEAWTVKEDEDSDIRTLEYIGGVDISFVKGDDVNACAAFVIVKYPSLELVYKDLQLIKLTAPYIPGFLAFRETPSLVEMIQQQRKEKTELGPDVIMVDGNGTIHPRKFGLACHLGVLLDIPCLGVAKTLFQVDGLEKNSEHKARCAQLQKAGDTFPLVGASGDTLGKALRSRDNSPNPIYVSPGHKLSLDTAVELVAKCCKFRIPEPTRQADVLSREYLRENFQAEDKKEDPQEK